MESANHEFTWMSGRAQWSSGCSTTTTQVALPAQPKSSPKSRQDDNSLTVKNLILNSEGRRHEDTPDHRIIAGGKSSCSSSTAKKPIPLPRIFRRLSSSSSSASSSLTSSSDSSTPPPPPTTTSSSARIYDLPPAFESHATFYVSTVVDHSDENETTALPVDRSVIEEFDPIMQTSKEESTAIETQECDLYLPSETDIESCGNEASSRDPGPLDGLPVMVTLDERPPPTRPTPKPRRTDVVTSNVAAQSPELPPKLSKSLKFGLSTVPPPPASEPADMQPVMSPLNHGDETLNEIQTQKTISPIHVDNPCYMFFGLNISSDDCRVVEAASGGGDSKTPKAPSYVPLKDDVSDFFTPPDAIISSNELQCPPAPRCCKAQPQEMYSENGGMVSRLNVVLQMALAADDGGGGGLSAWTAKPAAFRTFPQPKIPIYQNLLEISGSREGVYAQIRKAPPPPLSVVTTAATPASPPPLPPRGQQRCSPTTENGSTTSHAVTIVRTLSRRSAQLTEVIRNIPHRGPLLSIGRGRKDITQKWAILERGHLQLFADDKSDNPKEIFHQSDIVSIGRSPDVKHNHREMACFELVACTGKDRPSVFGTKYAHERDAWIQHVVQSIAPADLLSASASNINKAGYVQIRKAVSGVWHTHWMVLSSKKLGLWSTVDSNYLELDLRKVMFMQEYERDPQASMALTEDWPLFVVHYPALTLYVTSKVIHDVSDWYQRLRRTSLDTGRGLDEQQLTHEDVPVVVDKCLKFISTYGISTKGMYRESGTNSKISRLMDSFQKDAWKVHIAPDEYSEHDVANVLKRFLRTLPEALLMKHFYQQWIAAQTMTKAEAIPHYIHLLSQLPRINYMTLKKLIAHLKSVSEQDQLNLMDVSNLAAIFGPTLLSTESDVILSNARAEVFVVSDLVTNYAQLFGVSIEEIEKEEKIQKALHELREARRAQKPAGDILVGIYVHSRQWGKCLNVKLSPTMTAFDLCQYAIQQTRMRDRVENLVIFEVVCNAEMERPLHYSENVLGVTLRWACWSEADARDSYLLLRKSEIFHRIVPLARQPLSMFGELRFADIKSKSFKKLMFEFKNARLAYYKDAKISQPLGSWNIEDIAWYIGSDSQRPKPTEWSLTFIEQKAVIKRGTKETPYFGRTICFSSEEEFYRWMAAMITGQYPNGILPRVEPVDLLT